MRCRIPSIKEDLGLSDGQLGDAFAVLNAGAIVGLQFGRLIVTRLGSRVVLWVAVPMFSAALMLPPTADGLPALAVALFGWAALNSVVDVAVNAQGVLVERYCRRPILSGLHAMHSVGGITGGVAGLVAADAGLAVAVNFAVIAIITTAFALPAGRFLMQEVRDEEYSGDDGPGEDALPLHPAPSTVWPRPLIMLGGVAFCLTLVEGSALDWSAVYLHDELGAVQATSSAAVTVLLCAMAAGRLIGDRIRQRFGPVRALRCGCAVACGGIATALAAPSPDVGVLGFGMLGLGLSYTLPLAISAAGGVVANRASAVARVSTLAYAGSFTGPWLIGGIADRVGLTIALIVPAVSVVLAGLLMRDPARYRRADTPHTPAVWCGAASACWGQCRQVMARAANACRDTERASRR